MLFSPILERFVEKAPLSVMVRALLENALSPDKLDALFRKTAQTQHQRELLFSSIVDLMTVVVCKVQPSLHAAYQAVVDTLPVSIQAVYPKLAGIEPEVVRALVQHTTSQLSLVVDALGARRESWIAGYRVKILDGSHLAATERRLQVLWDCQAAPLPGQSLVILEPERGLVTDMIPCEDGHAQERSLLDQVLATVAPKDLFVADRNFCTMGFLLGLHERGARFAIRQHAGLPVLSYGTLRHRGRTDTGEVFEQTITLGNEEKGTLTVRRIVVKLDTPTRDGDTEMAILTDLRVSEADGCTVAEIYRKRWTLETLFLHLTQFLQGEIDTLAYPRAALFGFGLALCAINVVETVLGSLRVVHGETKVDEEVSGYYVANEVRRMYGGLDVMVEDEEWEPLRKMTPKQVAACLKTWAAHAVLERYKKHPRGPKKPKKARTQHTDSPHASTARLLLRGTGKITP